jgi:hypothetical protein
VLDQVPAFVDAHKELDERLAATTHAVHGKRVEQLDREHAPFGHLAQLVGSQCPRLRNETRGGIAHRPAAIDQDVSQTRREFGLEIEHGVEDVPRQETAAAAELDDVERVERADDAIDLGNLAGEAPAEGTSRIAGGEEISLRAEPPRARCVVTE